MANGNSTLSRERLREVLIYDPESGKFTWRKTTSSRSKAGSEAGSTTVKGYRVITVYGRAVYAHRLAFLYMTGRTPNCPVDHKNRNRLDNRWENLRLSSPRENQHNNRGRGWTFRSGKPNPYEARIRIGGKIKYLGSFPSAQDAESAYLNAKKKYHSSFVP